MIFICSNQRNIPNISLDVFKQLSDNGVKSFDINQDKKQDSRLNFSLLNGYLQFAQTLKYRNKIFKKTKKIDKRSFAVIKGEVKLLFDIIPKYLHEKLFKIVYLFDLCPSDFAEIFLQKS